jgi:acyl-CoA dehydrogenase
MFLVSMFKAGPDIALSRSGGRSSHNHLSGEICHVEAVDHHPFHNERRNHLPRRRDQESAAMSGVGNDRAAEIAADVEQFVRDVVLPYEKDPRLGSHGPADDLVAELRAKAKVAGVLTPHVLPDGSHLTQRETAMVLKASGLSPLGPVAVNTMAPDEGNMFLLGKVASPEQKEHFLKPMIAGEARSAFFMTEPPGENGAGSDPSMMKTTAVPDGNHWVINGRKTFITGAEGAKVGIVMAKGEEGASLFLIDLPNPAIKLDRILDTIDSSMPGGHAVVTIENLRVPADQMLGNPGEGFKYAQIRLSPARLSHCMRWFGSASRAHEIATAYACHREAFGKKLIDHEGVGFQLADNLIDLKQAELMIDWCADVLDTGVLGTAESSMTKVAVSEALYRVADRCVQVMGAMGVSRDTIVEQVFREIRAFRIYDGPTEVHKWSLAKKIKRDFSATQ